MQFSPQQSLRPLYYNVVIIVFVSYSKNIQQYNQGCAVMPQTFSAHDSSTVKSIHLLSLYSLVSKNLYIIKYNCTPVWSSMRALISECPVMYSAHACHVTWSPAPVSSSDLLMWTPPAISGLCCSRATCRFRVL